MSKLAWYPIKVKGGQESKIKPLIEQEISKQKLGNLFGEIFVPYQRVYQVKNGKKVVKKRHFAYIVVKADLGSDKMRNLIISIPGVRGFISTEGWGAHLDPFPLEEEEVNNMLGNRAAEASLEDDTTPTFKEGDNIKISDGWLKDKPAVIKSLDNKRKKIEAIIKIFGKETKIELNYSQVKKN